MQTLNKTFAFLTKDDDDESQPSHSLQDALPVVGPDASASSLPAPVSSIEKQHASPLPVVELQPDAHPYNNADMSGKKTSEKKRICVRVVSENIYSKG